MVHVTEESVLQVLDSAASSFEFPILDNGYVYPVDVRLSAYGDRWRWAIAIEHLGVFNRDPSFLNYVYGFGNCLIPTKSEKDFVSAEAFQRWKATHAYLDSISLYPVTDGTSELLEQDYDLRVNPNARDLKLRDILVPIPPADLYETFGIQLESPLLVMFYVSVP